MTDPTRMIDRKTSRVEARFQEWWPTQTACGIHNSMESSSYFGFKGGYAAGAKDGYFEAMRHLFIQWRGVSCMETRQADRWTWGVLCRYLDEQCGVKDESVSGMEQFFGLEPAYKVKT